MDVTAVAAASTALASATTSAAASVALLKGALEIQADAMTALMETLGVGQTLDVTA